MHSTGYRQVPSTATSALGTGRYRGPRGQEKGIITRRLFAMLFPMIYRFVKAPQEIEMLLEETKSRPGPQKIILKKLAKYFTNNSEN